MDRWSSQQRFRITAAALCLVGWVSASYAAPPSNAATPSRGSATAQTPSERIHLDLTPPILESVKSALLQSTRPHSMGTEEHSGLSLSAEAWQDKPSARMADLVRRVHREGLPVARLWENRSALVSLGLNQRGKPGLWIIQKTQ